MKFSGALVICANLLLAVSTEVSATTLKIATLSPDGSSWMNNLRDAAQIISDKTDGRVKFKFYPGGIMGNDKAVLRKMRVKQLHGAAFSNGSLSKHSPEVQLYNLVMKFRSLDEVDYVRKKMDKFIINGLEANGLVTFGLSEIGFAYLMSQEPIRTVEDLRKRKVWIPEGNNVAAEAVSAFKVSPIPLPLRDVLVALQTGMVDTVAGSPTGALTLQWHTQVKYLTNLPLSYIYGVLALDERAFKRISLPDQSIVRAEMEKVTQTLDRLNRQDNLKALEAIKNQGVEIIKPDHQAQMALENMIEPANQKLMKTGKLSSKSVEVLNQHLINFRTGKKHSHAK